MHPGTLSSAHAYPKAVSFESDIDTTAAFAYLSDPEGREPASLHSLNQWHVTNTKSEWELDPLTTVTLAE